MEANKPVYFLTTDSDVWFDCLGADGKLPSLEDALQRNAHRTANRNWCVFTWMYLKEQGENVVLSDRYVPGHICVTSYDGVDLPGDPRKSYVVVCQHDRPRTGVGDRVVVQNQYGVQNRRFHFIPHWPQPNIIRRSPKRQHSVSRIQYHGRIENLGQGYRSPAFRQELERRELTLVTGPSDREAKFLSWNDYSQSDVILAVREDTLANIRRKPASKLVNAWIAEVPAIIGVEPGPRELRRSELDYIEVANPQEALMALDRLKTDPDLYTAMVENGKQRSVEFSKNSLVCRWIEFLDSCRTEHMALETRASQIQTVRRRVQHQWRKGRHRFSKAVFDLEGGYGLK